MKNKRGVTTQTIIISIIILLLSGGIIFYFIAVLPYRELIDKQACRQSVLLRSQTIAGIRPGPVLDVPLNCHTREIIISESDSSRIMREIANEMYDCWWMFGEGKLDFFDESTWKAITGLEGTRAACMICATVKFEESAKKGQKLNLIEYMEKTKVADKNYTYLDYFLGGQDTKLPPDLRIEVEELDMNQEYAIIFMGAKGDSLKQVFKDLGKVNFIILGSTAGVTGLKGTVGGLIALATNHPLVLLFTEIGLLSARLGFMRWNQYAAFQHCSGETEGCYALVLVPLTAENLKENCQVIESIP